MKEVLKLGLELQDSLGAIGCLETLLKDVSAKLTHIRDDAEACNAGKSDMTPTMFFWDNMREIRILSELMIYLTEELSEIREKGLTASEQLLVHLRGKQV